MLTALGARANPSSVLYDHHERRRGARSFATIPEDASESRNCRAFTNIRAGRAGREIPPAPALLKRLNPRARFIAGEHIRVPNVLGANKLTRAQAGAVKIVVSKKASVLMVYDWEGQVIFYAPVTSGSEHDPLPFGNWVITDVVEIQPTTTTRICSGMPIPQMPRSRSQRVQTIRWVSSGWGSTYRTTGYTARPKRGRSAIPVSRVRADDKLGRQQGRRPGQRWDARHVRGMRKAIPSVRRGRIDSTDSR